MSSQADSNRQHWAHLFALRTVHEATLEILLRAGNYATLQLFDEHNGLLCEQ
jgi:hypothetical protein